MIQARPLAWSSIIGFGLGDAANNFAFAMGALFLLNYYTDVVGIPAAAAGTMLMLVRIYDALMDLVAGRVVDGTKTRWGRFRPFLLWGSAPLMLLNIAVFSVPADWGDTEKLIYAYVSYALLGTAYSFVNIPYGALATAMTQAPRDRARLGVSRALMATFTFSFLALVLGPVVRSAQGEALQNMLTQFTSLLAVLGVVLYFLCFKNTREVVERDITHPKLKASMATLLSNRPLLMLCLGALCVLIGNFSAIATAMFFARYVLGDPAQFAFIIGTMSLLGTVVAAPLVPTLVGRFGKKGTFLVGLGMAALGFIMFYVAPLTCRNWIFSALGVASVGIMLAMTVMWALEADTVEYGEWRTGVRIEGLTYSLFSFTRKCGQALGGSVPAFLLATSDYVPNAAVQSAGTIRVIMQGMALIPAIAFVIAFVLMLFYPLTDVRFAQLLQEIKARREAAIRTNPVCTQVLHGDSAVNG